MICALAALPSAPLKMTDSIIDISHQFFNELVKPILETHFPQETAQTAFGVFGYGSEALGLDDEYSRDHHWGLRIDALMPEAVYRRSHQAMIETVRRYLPDSYQGHSLREGHLAGAGLAPDSLEAFLRRTIGRESPPETYADWLAIPEEDIIHIINGAVWHDPLGTFTAVRQTFNRYYPEPVRLRRIAHWSRYYSGMGTYALMRALLRRNEYYATVTFSKAVRWGVQLAFLLEKQYCPYDKWTMAYLERLPRLGKPVQEIVNQAASLATSWEEKLRLLNKLSDLLDRVMVADGIIQPHPQFAVHPTSGYRLLERAYAEIIQGLPDEIKTAVPVWDQIYMEQFHSGYVNSISLEDWTSVLNLRPQGL